MNHSLKIVLVLAATVLAMSGAAIAHELIMPAAVQADGSGHFEFEAIAVITEPIEFAYSYANGNDNTDIGEWYADGFCTTILEPGEYPWPFEGNLLDPAQNGSVYYEHVMCDNWMGSGTTIVLAPTVGTEAVSWSAVKGLYR